MYGYILPDKPNMFVKDFTLYRAFYCGLCKSIGKMCGQWMRFSTNYDMTFLSILAHATADAEVEISNEGCILNPVKKKSIVKHDAINEQIVYINNILAHYKCVDDVLDNGSVGKNLIDKTVLSKHYKRAKKALPKVDEAARQGYADLRALESENCGSLDRIAHPFAQMMRSIAKELFADGYTEPLGEIMYQVGKWIYLVDAIDDIDDDFRKKKFNPFLVGYEYRDKATFLAEKGGDARLALMTCYQVVCDSFKQVTVAKYEGVLTNIFWYGMLEKSNEILRSTVKCKKTRI